MSDLNMEEEEKIPYDSEPIDRNKSADYYRYVKWQKKQQSAKTPPKASKLSLAVIAMGLLVVIMGICLFGINSRVSKLKDSRSDYTMNISATGEANPQAIAKGMLSTVCVSASSSNNCTDATVFFSKAMASRGSGVIYDIDKKNGDAYIITNYHVVSTQTKKVYNYRWVLLWDSIVPVQAAYVGGSSVYDIAVLKIEGSEEIKKSSAASVSLGSSAGICVGESVCAIGNSMARNLRITTGVVSVEEDLMGASNFNMYLSHSADVNSGNSGGGLYNSRGELVGIVNAKYRDVNPTSGELMYKEVIHGMNYAIPVDLAVSVAKNIIRNDGHLLKPNVGLTLGDGYSYNDKFYEITDDGLGYTTYSIIKDKVSSVLGDAFWVNDKFVSMTYEYAGEKVSVELNRLFAIESNLFYLSKGDKVEFVVIRGGIETKVKLTIGSVVSVE